MEATAFVTHFFKHADVNKNMKLEGAEKEQFLVGIEQVLHQLPGFDMSSIRSICGDGDMTHKHIKDIIDEVANFGTGEKLPAPQTLAEANNCQSDTVVESVTDAECSE